MDDRYVTGGTNWDSYELPQLIAMVTDKVDLRGLAGLADDWRWTGNELVETADGLGSALDGLMDFWSGAAARQARTDVALNAQWLSDLGATAYQIGTPVEEAAGALKAAQDQMPELPDVDPAIAPGSAWDGASAAGFAGGPLGAAIGATAAGTESAAQAQLAETELKRQAVETMRRFETAAMGIDQAIPVFEGPSSVLRPRPDPRRPKPPDTRPAPPPTDPGHSWQDLTGGGSQTGTSAQGFGGHGGAGSHSGTLAGTGTGAFRDGSDRHGGLVGAGGPGGRIGGAGSESGGPGTGTARPPAGERAPGVLPAASAGMIDPDGHPGGAAGGGAPMGGGMGAGAGGGTGNDHRRRFPFDADEPFALDQKASPPVIGL
jgi:hypothetical protein